MNLKFINLIQLSLIYTVKSNKDLVIVPNVKAEQENVAIIFIIHEQSKPENQRELANKIHDQFADHQQNVWIQIPDWQFGVSSVFMFMSSKINKIREQLREIGFFGTKVFLGGHSRGGIMAQHFLQANKKDEQEGLILFNSVIQRTFREISNGNTTINLEFPVLTICGEKDGLLRVTRCAESYWHQQFNIGVAQMGTFPVTILEGMSHWSFAGGMPPETVLAKDLKAEIDRIEGQQRIAASMLTFICKTRNDCSAILTEEYKPIREFTKEFVKPLIIGMEMEGYKGLKPPCQKQGSKNNNLDCLSGSPWVNLAQSQMADIRRSNITIRNHDIFGNVSKQTGSNNKLPQVQNQCERNTTNSFSLMTYTMSENVYHLKDILDNGSAPVAAWEIRSILNSRWVTSIKTGIFESEFSDLDMKTSICKEINEKAIEWALEHSSERARQRQLSKGTLMVTGMDIGPFSSKSEWILNYINMIKFVENEREHVSVNAPAQVNDHKPNVHQCKLISPFQVMEWIQGNGLRTHDGIKNDYGYT